MATADPMTRVLEAVRNQPGQAVVRLTVENGDEIDVHLSYASGADETNVPSLGLDIEGGTPVNDRERGGEVKKTRTVTDTFTYSADQDVYQVTERDIDAVNSLTAIVNGSSTTLTEGTDFQVISTADYLTDDAIEFLDGGTKPDDGTDFDLDYDHKLFAPSFYARMRETARLELRVPVLDQNQSGTHQAYHDPTHIGIQLRNALLGRLIQLQGANLWPTAVQDPNEANPAPEPGMLVLGSAQSVGARPKPEDESYREFIVDVRLKNRIRVEGEEARALGKPEISTTEDLG